MTNHTLAKVIGSRFGQVPLGSYLDDSHLNECIVPLGEPEIITSLKLVWEMLPIAFKNGWVASQSRWSSRAVCCCLDLVLPLQVRK